MARRVEPPPLSRRPQLLRPLPRLGAVGGRTHDIGFVRSDGKTLIAQPHLDSDKMWTLDDLKSMDFKLQSPNITVAENMGLPSGSSASLGAGQETATYRRQPAGCGAVVERQR